MKNRRILIVDDEADYLSLLQGLLNSEGYDDVVTEQNPLNVPPLLQREDFDLIILDVYMPQMNGIDLLEIISQDKPRIPVIIVTAVDNIDIALRAIKLGAYEYITKPPETERLFLTIKRALNQKLLEDERDSLRGIKLEEIHHKNFNDIITRSPLMHKVFELVEIFAPTQETILIEGETGTGKDLIARKIHEFSPRKNASFVTVNIASISSSLFESELFGHERGAFTGALIEKKGFFEAANGGTIFLDEIGELPKELQGKLLRTIQYGEIYRIGSSKPIKLDIRIIAATNKNLLEAVNKKEFRADLYYRLNRGYIHLPPLRMRGDDVLLLADFFRRTGNKLYNKNVTGYSDEVSKFLKKYHFPGNIREIENLVLNAIAKTSEENVITSLNIHHVQHDVQIEAAKMQSYSEEEFLPLDIVVDNYIEKVLNSTGRNLRKAAYILGISERTLQRRIKEKKEQNPLF